jgi:hypothetical protein
MEIECTSGEKDQELLDWADAGHLWEALELYDICLPSENSFIEPISDLDVYMNSDELDDYGNVDPDYYPYTIVSFGDERAVKRAFIRRMIEVAYENRDIIAEKIVPDALPDNEVDDLFFHAGASAFRKPNRNE